MNDGLTGVCLLLAGSIYFPLVYTAISRILTKHFKPRLSTGDICLISEKCTCSVQALMSFVAGLVIVSQVKDIMMDTHWLSNRYACFALPYFASDLWAMYLTHMYNKDDALRSAPLWQRLRLFVGSSPLLLLHHTVMPIVIFPAIIFFRRNLGDFFVGAFYMIEVTIPFISAQSIMVQLNMKTSPYYVLVGVLMLVSFFVSRVLVFPYLYWRYALYAGVDLVSVPGSIPLKCNLACLMILLPQLYWCWLMVRGVIRVFYKIFRHWTPKSHRV